MTDGDMKNGGVKEDGVSDDGVATGTTAAGTATLTAARVRVGEELPPLRVEVTPTMIVSTAIATRDFQDVHHDRDAAHARGSKDIFLNILTDTGLVQRFVTDWAGPEAFVRSIKIRLGVPCYAYDTLTLRGTVAECLGAEVVIEVLGRGALGDHVTGTVSITLPDPKSEEQG